MAKSWNCSCSVSSLMSYQILSHLVILNTSHSLLENTLIHNYLNWCINVNCSWIMTSKRETPPTLRSQRQILDVRICSSSQFFADRTMYSMFNFQWINRKQIKFSQQAYHWKIIIAWINCRKVKWCFPGAFKAGERKLLSSLMWGSQH